MEQNSKRQVMLCTDDICPSFVKKYWRYWEELKNKIPHLKLNCFVIPHFCKLEVERITRQIFKNWYKKNSSWISLHLHGYDHTYPAENTRSYYLQEALITMGKIMLSEILGHENFGYKAPGYFLNDDTQKALRQRNFRFICHQLDVEYIIKPSSFTNFSMVQTHTNSFSYDSIQKIHSEILDLNDSKFITFDELYAEKKNPDNSSVQ